MIMITMKLRNDYLLLSTVRLRVLPLSSTRRVDPPHQGGGPKPGSFHKHLSLKFPGFGGG